MTGSILSYRQKDSVKLLCEIDLIKLLPDPKQSKGREGTLGSLGSHLKY